MKLKIKKGDNVIVIAGNDKDRSKVRRVIQVYPSSMKVLVEGVNVRSKATRPSQVNPNGGILKLEMPIHYSNVQLVDKNGKPTRVGTVRTLKSGDKQKTVTRIARSTNEEL